MNEKGRFFLCQFFLCLTLCLLSSTIFAEIKGHGVEVRLTSPGIVETLPGKIVTSTFLVSNHTNQKEIFLEELKLPSRWQPLIPLDSFPLKPGEKELRIIALSVPADSPPGIYEITYSVKSQRDYSITDQGRLSVKVLPIFRIESNVEEKPSLVIGGQPYRVKMRIFNYGNIKTTVKLEIKGFPDYPINIEPSREFTLEAGSSRLLTIEVKTDEKTNRKTTHILKIKALAEEVSEVSTEQSLPIEIIPRVTGKVDPYQRIAGKVKLSAEMENREGSKGGQVELSGAGSLDEEGKRRIDFLLRGPDVQSKSIFGERDEYWFSFYSKTFDIHLGDRIFSLSPLTGLFEYGRGVGIDYHPEKFGMGVFLLNTRWSEPKEREIGEYLKYRYDEGLEIKGNFLNRSISERNFTDNLFSLEGKIKRDKRLDLELEGGFGQSSRKKKVSDYAYRANLKGHFENDFYYLLRKTYAGPGFWGYYHGVDHAIGTIGFPIFRKLRGNLNFSYLGEKFDPEIETQRTTANRELLFSGELSYSLSSGTDISLNYEDFRKEDRMRPVDYNLGSKIFRLGLGQRFRKLGFNINIERGRTENKLSSTENDYASYYLYGMLQPTTCQNYGIYFRYGQTPYSESPQKTLSGGITGNWKIKNRLDLTLSFYRNISYQDYREEKQERDGARARLTYTLPFNHSIELGGRWSKFLGEGKPEISAYLNYIIPLQIPVGKKKSVGMIRGRVYDEERPGKPPINNVILIADGISAVTDRDGRFVFPGLKPGDYHFQIERGSIGSSRTTSERLPVVTVRGGETTEIEIGVATACKISGQVILFAPKKEIVEEDRHIPEEFREAGGFAGAFIEISRGEEVIRQLTDGKGSFSFEGIRPGVWKLKVYEESLPAFHFPEKGEFELEFKPGQEEEITIKVLARPRRIKMIE